MAGAETPTSFVALEHAIAAGGLSILRLDATTRFVCGDLLRHLPGRRLVVAGWMDEQSVVAKFFPMRGKAAREFVRELSTMQYLAGQDQPVPEPILQTENRDWACFVMPRIDGVPGGRVYREGHMDPEQLQRRLAGVLGKLFEAGFVQTDLHLDNFVFAGGRIYILDAGSIEKTRPSRLAAGQWRRTLARLLIQFYPVDLTSPMVTDLARELNVTGDLEKTVTSLRRRRLHSLMKKSSRESTRYSVVDKPTLSGMVMRDGKDRLRTLLAGDLDVTIRNADTIKAGNSATVVRYRCAGTDWVIKRYNTKGIMTALKRRLFSRARRSWRNALWLEFNGLTTPPPVAFLREQGQGLRAREYYITEYVPGSLLKSLSAEELMADARILQQLAAILTVMRNPGFVHGDFKAANFLVDNRRCLHLLDLDAMRPCRPKRRQRRKVEADRARLLRNWPAEYRPRLRQAITN
jgi:tRNA A-37 threonylcarbamoyl transferase component Bud32